MGENIPLENGISKSLEITRPYLGARVDLMIDRPWGTNHKNMVYTQNYGSVPDTLAPDGGELDAYFIGPQEPLETASGDCIAIIHRHEDDDDKLIVVPTGTTLTDEEIEEAVHFQEQWFRHTIIRE